MSNDSRGLIIVNKSHCYRTLVTDVAPGDCSDHGNQCMMCYDQRFSRVRKMHEQNGSVRRKFNLDKVRKQLSNPKLKLNRKLEEDRVVRIGALGDIMKDDKDNYEQYRLLCQMINSYGFHYILCTKSSHSIDTSFLEDIARHDGMLQVSMGCYSDNIASKFERMDIIPVHKRRRLVENALDIGVQVVLRLCPLHPDYLYDHMRVLNWFSNVGGTRVILETVRILTEWAKRMPEVDFTGFVTVVNGGGYNNYYTPHRDTQESMFKCLIEAAHVVGISNVTICGDMDSQDKYGLTSYLGRGQVLFDCCQACNHWNIPRPPKTWNEEV